MWTLFRNTVMRMTLAASEDRQALAKAIADVKADIAQSKRVLEEISGMMAQMAQMSLQESPEYKRVFAAYQNLSRLVTEASKELKNREEQQVQDMRATQSLPEAHDFTGVVAIKSTLGPTGRPGFVSRGAEIVNLQKFLSIAGFVVPESGDFDVKTRMAVQQFQTKYGLKADGTVGAGTRKLINELLKQ